MEFLTSYCMELLTPYAVSLATVLPLLLILFHCKAGFRKGTTGSSGGEQNNKPKKKKKPLPPGPWTLPIIGSIHHVMLGLGLHRTTRELSRRHGPLMLLRLGEVPTLVVSSAEAAELVMKTHDLAFCSRPTSSATTMAIVGCEGKGIAFAPYGEHWRLMKKIVVTELLCAAQVKRIESIRAEEVGRVLRSVAAASAAVGAAGVVNISQVVKTLAPDLVARAMFGGKCAGKSHDFIVQYDQVSELLSGSLPVDLFPSSRLARWLSSIGERRLRKSCSCIQRIIATIIESRREAAKNGGSSSPDHEDMLGVLLRLQEEDSLSCSPLTSEIIGAVMFDIFGGATTTIGSTLEWAMAELMRKPEAMEKAQEEVRNALDGSQGVITTTRTFLLNSATCEWSSKRFLGCILPTLSWSPASPERIARSWVTTFPKAPRCSLTCLRSHVIQDTGMTTQRIFIRRGLRTAASISKGRILSSHPSGLAAGGALR
ncbi:hypothetical protein BS78_K286000 [Paspalum vaginatum]|uniref:Cytochrome P450 n=1 Tax=Paspalum vaginatum TaxID=158149 RepID=A0A9W8CET4_9POAL|nr:hypothetical protein BS78_K286000 [Paspalum vaginatum]